ncbi:hypothetical protein PHLCEN_2v765 [Hermanssonia centrifuga]|uniref:Uncharacterized protein n=1 Tax=Hermanssonia centrifuga TaxID=98765 RepID=A0A2R6S536_9APHY|nr:hypothetical protein PHLCEN_2v765 [Hermanssonia centrifuga]
MPEYLFPVPARLVARRTNDRSLIWSTKELLVLAASRNQQPKFKWFFQTQFDSSSLNQWSPSSYVLGSRASGVTQSIWVVCRKDDRRVQVTKNARIGLRLESQALGTAMSTGPSREVAQVWRPSEDLH